MSTLTYTLTFEQYTALSEAAAYLAGISGSIADVLPSTAHKGRVYAEAALAASREVKPQWTSADAVTAPLRTTPQFAA